MSSSKTWLSILLLVIITMITVSSAYEQLYSNEESQLVHDFNEDEILERTKRHAGMYSKRDELAQPANQNVEKRQYCGYGSTELCCGNKVYRGNFPYNAVCCGNDYIDSNTALCCNNVVKLINGNQYQMACCGSSVYNTSSQICCNNKIYAQTGNLGCCGSSSYNPTTQICCNGNVSQINGQILSCCQNIAYQLNDYNCINGNLQEKPNNESLSQVCGSETINYDEQVCCQGTPQPRTSDMTLCCGSITIDSSSQLCCNGTVYNNPGNASSCCQKQLYNTNEQVCCNGNVLSRPVNSVGDNSYCNPQIFFGSNSGGVFQPYSPYFTCCGTQLLTNYTTQICCTDTLYNIVPYSYSQSCCGSNLYNSSTQTCCANEIILDDPNQSCCGTDPYDLNEQVCCNGTIYSHNSVPANTCC